MGATAELDHRFLAETGLFAGLSPAETLVLLRLMDHREVAAGEVVVVEGSMGDTMFLLYSGALEVVTQGSDGREVRLATLDAQGAFLGEMSLVDPGPRSATVRATRDSVLLELAPAGLEALFAAHPDARVAILRNIARVLAQRLRQANVRVAATCAS